jgi:DNA polymerase-3 subunit delta
MKADKSKLGQSLERPDQGIRFYLFHGPDEAGSRALAIRLLKGLGDAEKFIVLGQSVKSDPASLTDEAGAMALFGGKRAIWIEPAGDEIVEGVTAVLEAPACENAVIALAGTLRKTSSLLKLAEFHPAAWAHCSYVPDGRDMVRLVSEIARSCGLSLSSDVASRISASAGNNQAIASQELMKFATFLDAGPGSPRELDHETIDLLGADSAEGDMMRLGDLALSGRMDELLDELSRLPHGGSETIPALRALQRRILMLAPMRARVEQGEKVDAVMASAGKALFWKDKPVVSRLLSTWSAARLGEIAARVGALERQVMLRPLADEAALGEMLVTVARASRSRT